MLTAATTRVSVAAALYAIAVGALTLLGWARDVYRLTDWTGGGIRMKANPAVGALLAPRLLGESRATYGTLCGAIEQVGATRVMAEVR